MAEQTRNFLLIIILAAMGVFLWERNRTISQPNGWTASKTPIQRPLNENSAKYFRKGDWNIIPLAHYELKARVLSYKNYWFDTTANLSRTDLALSWGIMSDNSTINEFKIRQNNRFYYLTAKNEESLSIDLALKHSANTHIIPANKQVSTQLWKIRKGHIIEAKGYLVECVQGNNPPWSSSLTRNDSGDGACEIFYVEQLSIVD